MTDTEPDTSGDGPDEPVGRPGRPAGWLVLSVAVMVSSFGLLALPQLGLTFLGGLGLLGVFALGEALGLGGLVFTLLSLNERRRGDADLAHEDVAIGRRCAIAGAVFLVVLAVVTGAAHVVPTAMVS